MRFSVCIPCYNAQRYISVCIDSILSQTHEDYEIIIVDDGSTDNSRVICEQYALVNENVRVFHQSNQGLVTTRSVLISYANGEYCVFVDADDYLSKDALEILNQTINKYDKPDCIMFGLERVRDGKRIEVSTETKTQVISDRLKLYRKVLSSDSNNSICRKCLKTEILRKYDESLHIDIHIGEDLLRSLSVYKYSDRVVFIRDVLYSYVMNEESMVHSVTPKNFQPSYLLYMNVSEFLTSEGVDDYRCTLAIRTLYAQKLVRDVLQIARFQCTHQEQIRSLETVVANSNGILSQPIMEEALGRRKTIYMALQKKNYLSALRKAQIENRITEISTKIRGLIK